ncbi:hypothetical protein [Curtobacterium sp. MCPF17_052]|uniref:hypothetical protein n=1 Tax=Curtobacterium sp. MCPF17_052 TaxID=2175655 RepID=UPI0024DFCD5D|nr:hypothetical protein [Curtobacterium sp. MCPF17_052]WIB13181.1 hypothetical protein DEJ36_04620 [Curtobacterium sp. MCPF17_052]
MLPLAQTFDTVGWLTRDPELLRQVVGIALGDTAAQLRGADAGAIRTAPLLLSDALLDAAEPGTRSAFLAWVERTVRPVRSVELPDLDDLAETLRIVQAAEAHRNHGDWVAAHPGGTRSRRRRAVRGCGGRHGGAGVGSACPPRRTPDRGPTGVRRRRPGPPPRCPDPRRAARPTPLPCSSPVGPHSA